MRSRRFWVAALAVHFLFIGAVSFWDIIDLIGSGRTMLPQTIAASATKLAEAMRSISPRQFALSNPIRRAIIGYSHIAGIESPYTFFAPNVPQSLKVVFEIHLADGRVIYDLPHVKSDTEALRLSALIDQAAAQPGLWRDVVLQMLAASAADMNPEAIRIRVVVEALKFPPPADYLNGAQPSYKFVCSYDFKPEEARQSDGSE
jgi:hypothetical protein